MSRCWLMLGKSGDVISVLTILHEEWRRTNEIQNLVVAREYASVAEGLDYVKVTPFLGDWFDFRRGYQFAKMMFDHVEVPMNHGQYDLGKPVQFERKTPSTFLDMWNRVGYLEKWDKLPLVLPRTSKTTLSGPTIFYADHSQSSPFFFKDDLHKLIQETFPTHQVMRASGMRLKNLRDFLPVMDASDLIVSVETSFLHLAKATETPIIALSSDQPDPWRGSPYSSKFAFHCRYGDYEARKLELTEAMRRAVNKMGASQPEIIQTAHQHGYNATMISANKFVYRYHPERNWRTKLAMVELFEGFGGGGGIQFPKECENYSQEDARYFELNGKPHLSYTCSDAVAGQFRSIQSYGPLEHVDGQWRITKHIVPKYAGNDFSGMQKNYVPIVRDNVLYFIWGNYKPTMEQVVLQMDGDKVVKEHRSPAPTWAWGGIRGGCTIPYRDHILRFFHSRTGDTNKRLGFRYFCGASLLESKPPFRTVAVSTFPILAGNEKFTPNCHHIKENVAICYGVIQDGDGFIISGGLNDCESFTMKLKMGDLNL